MDPVAAITNGQPDGQDHPYVGIVFNTQEFCSGTLLSPTVFLTAAHCAEVFAGTQTYVTFDPEPVPNPDLTQPWFFLDNAYAVSAVYTMPGYEKVFPQLTGFSRNDIGIVLLAEPVQLDTYGVLPDEGLLGTIDKPSTTFTAVGYGVQDFASGPGGRQPSASASRFQATMAAIDIPQRRSQVGDAFVHLTANPGRGKGGICFGDSGGPIFLGDSNVVVAVTAFVTNTNCAGQSYGARVDSHEALAFITSFL
jgi:secreted trypsin-like serine protease